MDSKRGRLSYTPLAERIFIIDSLLRAMPKHIIHGALGGGGKGD